MGVEPPPEIEDGTGLAGVVSYCSVDGALAYHGERGHLDLWQVVIDAGAAWGLLLDATRMLEVRYRWRGYPRTTTQGLGLPRIDLLAITSPAQIVDGLVLADGRVLTGPGQVALAADAVAMLALDLWRERPPADGRVVVSEQLPDYTIRYAQAAPAGFEAIERVLAPLIEPDVPPGYAVLPTVVVA